MIRGPRTPLALAALELLSEREMHPYEMQQLMRERGFSSVIKLKAGSLYSTVDRLVAAGFIEAGETSREGRRPERTVYCLTDSGREELHSWMRELVAEPIHEFPWFGAILAFISMLSRDEAAQLLEVRAIRLEAELVGGGIMHENMRTVMGLPRLFSIEHEYAQVLLRAELEWVRGIVEDIRTGELPWLPEALEGLNPIFMSGNKQEDV